MLIDRRRLLAASAACAAGMALPRSAFAALPEITLDPPVIDIHCHIFNACDLPVFGFVKTSVFEVFDEQVQVNAGFHSPCDRTGAVDFLSRPGLSFFAQQLETIALNGALTAQKESADLALGIEHAGGGPEARPLGDDLWEIFGPPSGIAHASGAPPSRSQRALEREFTPAQLAAGKEELRALIARESGADPGIARASAESAAAALMGAAADTETGRHFSWARALTTSRIGHARTVSRIYTRKVRLFTPALIDYSKWLDDEPVSPLSSQIDAMERVSLQMAAGVGARFHAFAAYDPLRDVHENGAALALAKSAVANRGFLGVKLYPPMGFKPLLNGNDPGLTFPAHALTRTGRASNAAGLAFSLDERLRALYDWCQRDGVPILAHAADSRGAGPCYSRRADTAFWGPVLQSGGFPRLPLCLAHVGSFDVARDRSGRLDASNRPLLENSWEWKFAKLTAGAPNLYADLSYFHAVLGENGQDRAALTSAFVQLLRAFPRLTERLVYGSDWIMLGRESGSGEHLKAVYWFMDDVLRRALPLPAVAPALRNIFSANAARLLGLAPGGAGRRRLTAFYARHRMPEAANFLREFS